MGRPPQSRTTGSGPPERWTDKPGIFRGLLSNDLLIAAHTLALDLILVTDKVEEFARVPGLSAENWLT